MSTEAVAWALRADLTGNLAAGDRLVLVSLADHASYDGANAWPSKNTLADRLGVTPRTVQRSLGKLESLGLIVKGDQRLVGHLRADKRPTVWNLRVGGRVRPEVPEDDGALLDETGTPYPQPGDSGYPQEPAERGDTNVTPSRGDKPRHNGETPTSPKPTTRTNHPPVVPPAPTGPGRRPDGTCRRCDVIHSPQTPCDPVGDHVTGMARVREALAAARSKENDQ